MRKKWIARLRDGWNVILISSRQYEEILGRAKDAAHRLAEVEALEKDASDARERAEATLLEQAAELKRAHEARATAESAASEALAQIEDVARQNESANQARNQAEARVRELEQERNATEALLNEVERQKSILEAIRINLLAKNANADAEYAAEITTLRSALEASKREATTVGQERIELQAELSKQRASTERIEIELRETRATHAAEIADLRGMLEVSKNKAAALDQERSELRARLSNLNASAEGFEVELREARVKHATEIVSLKGVLEITKAEVASLKRALEASENEEITVEQERAELQSRLSKSNASVEKLESELREARVAYASEVAKLDHERAELRAQLSNTISDYEGRLTLSAQTSDALAAEVSRLKVVADSMRLPGILIVTMVKSGTVFTRQMLSRGLDLEPVPIGFGYFPRFMVELPKLFRLAEGGQVGYSHADASPQNLQAIGATTKKWVVHIRDPRGVVLSWVHHMNRLYKERGNGEHQLLYVVPTPPAEYYGWPLKRQISWNIENFLPNVVSWTREWLEAIDSRRYDILLTTYSDLLRNEDEYIGKTLDFYAIPRWRWNRPNIEKTLQGAHFRTGRETEWLEVFEQKQIERANKIVGLDLLNRFGWSLGTSSRRPLTQKSGKATRT